MIVLVEGDTDGVLPVTDSAVLRGDGCFEAIRFYDGAGFRVGDHLDRMTRGAAALELEMPERSQLEAWVARVGEKGGDCIVRVVVTRGGAVPGADHPGHCVILAHPVPAGPETARLLPVEAPWHPAGRDWELSGVKSISYAPHMAASRRARAAGFDDALLVTDSGVVLEGPTFSVGWWRRGKAHTPSLRLGILDSITRRAVGELVDLEETVADLAELSEADEVFAVSTIKEVTPVVAIGDRDFPTGDLTRSLAQRFGGLTRPVELH